MTTMTAKQDMRTKMLRAAMTLAVMLMATVSAWAETMFITDVMLIGKNDKSEAQELKAQYVAQGWTAIDQDLNAGCGSKSDYIYLLYKQASNLNKDATFITDFYISDASGTAPDSRTVNGRTYQLVPYDGDSHFKSKKGDLNSNAGGDDIHLYYTKASFGDHNGVKSITFNSTKNGALGKNGDTKTGYDLNSGCGSSSDDIYMHVNKSKGWIIQKNISGDKCNITGYEGLTLEYTSIEIPTKIDKATVLGFNSAFNFSEFKNLEEMTFPKESVIDAMPSVQGCTKFKNIRAFYGVFTGEGGDLFDYYLPISITDIPAYTFKGTAITRLTMQNVTFVGTGAFEGCSLTSVTFHKPDKPPEIRSRAFGSISSSCEIEYYGLMTDWYPSIYQYSPNLTIFKNNTGWACGWCGGSKAADNNELYWTMEITKTIDDWHNYYHLTIACANNKWQTNPKEQVIKTSPWKKQVNQYNHISSLTTEHVYALGANEFKDYTDLETVELKDGITSIGASAFGGCTALTSATITGNPAIGEDAFPSGTTLTLNLSANDAEGEKWMTFYNNYANFQADASTKVYKATVSGTGVVLTEVEDRIVNAGTAVILRSSSDPVMTRTATASTDTHSNDLVGTMTETATPANAYTLANGSQGLGFYHYTGSNVAAGKAYLIYSGASAARSYIGFNETTGIVKMDDGRGKKEDVDGTWYNLDGRKLQGEPKDKGLYIKDGNIVVVK